MQHLNLSFIIENVPDEPEFIVMLLGVFKSNVDADLEALRASIEQENHVKIKKDAHKVKSSFRSLGIADMAQMLQSIEDMGKNEEDISEIRVKFNRLEQLLPEVMMEVDAYIAKHTT